MTEHLHRLVDYAAANSRPSVSAAWIVLLGGDKRGDWKRWYKRNIAIADDLYDEHLRG